MQLPYSGELNIGELSRLFDESAMAFLGKQMEGES